MKIPKIIHGTKVYFQMNVKHLNILRKYCEDTGQRYMEFMREVVEKHIREVSKNYYGIDIDTEIARYHQIYGFWTYKHALQPNTRKQWMDIDLVDKCLDEHGEEAVLEAITSYATILRKRDTYLSVPECSFEEFLSKHLTTFLTGMIPNPHERYRRPRMDVSPEILKFAKPPKPPKPKRPPTQAQKKKRSRSRRSRVSYESMKKYEEINKWRVANGFRPFTYKRYLKDRYGR